MGGLSPACLTQESWPCRHHLSMSRVWGSLISTTMGPRLSGTPKPGKSSSSSSTAARRASASACPGALHGGQHGRTVMCSGCSEPGAWCGHALRSLWSQLSGLRLRPGREPQHRAGLASVAEAGITCHTGGQGLACYQESCPTLGRCAEAEACPCRAALPAGVGHKHGCSCGRGRHQAQIIRDQGAALREQMRGTVWSCWAPACRALGVLDTPG